MEERSNEQWLADLQGEPARQTRALESLRKRLERSILYYLSHERSDMRDLAPQELQSLADDLAQDATLRVMENLANFRGESRFTTWANKIAIRLAISDLRRARYKDFSLDNLASEGDFLPASSNLVSEAPPNPETATEREDVRQRIEQALHQALTPRQAQALIAVALRGVPMDVVAEQMDTNRNALYKLIHDARRKLRTYLEEEGLSTSYMLNLFEN